MVSLVIVGVLGAYLYWGVAGRDDFPFSNYSIFSGMRLGTPHIADHQELTALTAGGEVLEGHRAPLDNTVFRSWVKRARREPGLRPQLGALLLRHYTHHLETTGRATRVVAVELRSSRYRITEAGTAERLRSGVIYRHER